MKKLLSVILVLIICLVTICSCESASNGNYEEKLLGTWVTSSGGETIMYFFEKEDDGTYTAGCITQHKDYSRETYMFDEFSASRTVITFRQDGKQTKNNYYCEDGYLYIDGLEFEKFEK